MTSSVSSARSPSMASVTSPSVASVRRSSMASAKSQSVVSVKSPSVASAKSGSEASVTHPSVSSAKSGSVSNARSPSVTSVRSPSMASAKSGSLTSAKSPSVVSVTSPSVASVRRSSMASAKSPSVVSVNSPSVASAKRQASVVSLTPPVVSPSATDGIEKLLKIRSYEEPLKDAVESNDCAFATLLIDPQQLSAREIHLLECARTNNVDEILMICNNPNRRVSLDTKNSLLRTALHLAAANGHSEIVQILIKARANRDAIDKYGMTPMMWAALSGHIDVVNALILGKASTTITSKQGLSVIHCAALGNQLKVLQLISHLVDPDDMELQINNTCVGDHTALHLAAERGYAKTVEQLLAMCSDTTMKNKIGQTALHLAASGGHTSVIQILLKFAHDVNEQDQNGATPLILAAAAGHARAVRRLLRDAMVNLNVADKKGKTALMHASLNGHILPAAILLHYKCDTNLRDEVLSNNLLTLKSKMADLAAADQNKTSGSDKNTALHLAVSRERVDIVRLLVAVNSDVNIINKMKQTPLHVAVELGNLETVSELLSATGLQLKVKDMNGKTPLTLAARADFPAIVDLIIKYDRIEMISKTLSQRGPQMFYDDDLTSENPDFEQNTSKQPSNVDARSDQTNASIADNSDIISHVSGHHTAQRTSSFDADDAMSDNASHSLVIYDDEEHLSQSQSAVERVPFDDLLATAGQGHRGRSASNVSAVPSESRSNHTNVSQNTLMDNGHNSGLSASYHNEDGENLRESGDVDAGQYLMDETSASADHHYDLSSNNEAEAPGDVTLISGSISNYDGEDMADEHLSGVDRQSFSNEIAELDGVDRLNDVVDERRHLSNEFDNENQLNDDLPGDRRVPKIVIVASKSQPTAKGVDRVDLDQDQRETKFFAVSPHNQRLEFKQLVKLSDRVIKDTYRRGVDANVNDDDDEFPIMEFSVIGGVCTVRDITRTRKESVSDVLPVPDSDINGDVDDSAAEFVADDEEDSLSTIVEDVVPDELVVEVDVNDDIDAAAESVADDGEDSLSIIVEDVVPDELVVEVDDNPHQISHETDQSVEQSVDPSSASVERRNSIESRLSSVSHQEQRPEERPDDGDAFEKEMMVLLWKLAAKQLKPNDWKNLAKYWKFSSEHIDAIQQQYTEPHSYRSHGYRLLSIWFQCHQHVAKQCTDSAYVMSGSASAIGQLYDALTAIHRRKLAEQIRKKLNKKALKMLGGSSCVIS